MRRPLANALDIDLAGGLTGQVTPPGGSALLIEVLRRSQVVAAAEKHLPAKKSTKGSQQRELIEAFILLSALGGECLDDFDQLRRDRGLAVLLGARPAGRIDGTATAGPVPRSGDGGGAAAAGELHPSRERRTGRSPGGGRAQLADVLHSRQAGSSGNAGR